MSYMPSRPSTASRTARRARRSAARERRADIGRQILVAAEEFLAEHPIRELTIDEVMGRTGLARTNFYRFFADREEMLLRVLEQAEREMERLTESWLEGEGRVEDDLQPALRGVTAAYERHGAVFRAFAEGSALEDGVRRAWRALIDDFIAATRQRIEREIEDGHSQVVDPEATARALVLMTDAFMQRECEHGAPDEARVVSTLGPIWAAAILQGGER